MTTRFSIRSDASRKAWATRKKRSVSKLLGRGETAPQPPVIDHSDCNPEAPDSLCAEYAAIWTEAAR
jgi:hypothetical protein